MWSIIFRITFDSMECLRVAPMLQVIWHWFCSWLETLGMLIQEEEGDLKFDDANFIIEKRIIVSDPLWLGYPEWSHKSAWNSG